ncbi:myoneurin-like [Pectinophora gossypiella]|nr:myoneurin-like [Pectinophora gossypiella]
MCENLQNCCRICLDVESDRVPIFEDPTIHLQIKSCLAITISTSDNLPKVICSSCVSQLSDFYNFQLNARCSQDWLESSLEEQAKKCVEAKVPIQPLPDSEYNSDSLLEFLNNTANIEEYLNNLGKEDIPSIVNMLDRNQENSMDGTDKTTNSIKSTKIPSPKKKETLKAKNCIKMEIDVLDSDIEIVKEIIMKEVEPKKPNQSKEKNPFSCFGCKLKFDNLQKLSKHMSICDTALHTCMHCNLHFDSRQKMKQHSLTHNPPLTCNCGKQFVSNEKLLEHNKTCHVGGNPMMNCVYRCKQCKATFKERFQLYKHAKNHIMKADERICDICGHSFIGFDALNKHKKEMHEKAKNSQYRCKICYYKSADWKEMYLHVQNHCQGSKQEVDRHLCESCGKSFATRATLQRHILQHTTDHRCNICQKIFADVKTRDEHVLGHIEMTMCEKCGQNVSSYKLEAHSCI